jgi:hypothetical protein
MYHYDKINRLSFEKNHRYDEINGLNFEKCNATILFTKKNMVLKVKQYFHRFNAHHCVPFCNLWFWNNRFVIVRLVMYHYVSALVGERVSDRWDQFIECEGQKEDHQKSPRSNSSTVDVLLTGRHEQ